MASIHSLPKDLVIKLLAHVQEFEKDTNDKVTQELNAYKALSTVVRMECEHSGCKNFVLSDIMTYHTLVFPKYSPDLINVGSSKCYKDLVRGRVCFTLTIYVCEKHVPVRDRCFCVPPN